VLQRDCKIYARNLTRSRPRGSISATITVITNRRRSAPADLIFCSGMVAVDPETGEREHGTLTSEARRIFENLKLLLESVGSSLDRTSVARQRKAPRRLPGTLGGGSRLRTLGTRSRKGDFRFGERDRHGADKRGSETVSM
jgi:hypothetical protein